MVARLLFFFLSFIPSYSSTSFLVEALITSQRGAAIATTADVVSNCQPVNPPTATQYIRVAASSIRPQRDGEYSIYDMVASSSSSLDDILLIKCQLEPEEEEEEPVNWLIAFLIPIRCSAQ